MVTHRIFQPCKKIQIVSALLATLVIRGCMNADDNDGNRDSVADHIETEHYKLDLTNPPGRADVGISENRRGLSVYFKDDSSRTFEAAIALPNGVGPNTAPTPSRYPN